VLTSDQISPEITDLLSAWERFDLGLRFREGVSESAYDGLRAALLICAEAWHHLPAIPRLGANVLVDMFPATEANADLYEGEIRSRILAMAFEIQDLVRECVAINEE
jgi:hypothetical protein